MSERLSPLEERELGYHVVCHDCDALEAVVRWESDALGDLLAHAKRHESTGHKVSVGEVRG